MTLDQAPLRALALALCCLGCGGSSETAGRVAVAPSAAEAARSVAAERRADEARAAIAQVRRGQEAFRAEFGQYLSAGGFPGYATDWSVFVPADYPSIDEPGVAWPGSSEFEMLGFAPDGPVTYRIRFAAGPPGTSPPQGITAEVERNDFWYAVEVEGAFGPGGEPTRLVEGSWLER